MVSDVNEILDNFFEKVDKPDKMDTKLGDMTETDHVSEEKFMSAFNQFRGDANAFVQAVQDRSSRDKSFAIVASLSVLFLVVVFALTYLLVANSMDVSVTLGADAAVLLGYLGLLHFMLKNQEKRWHEERVSARDAALFQLILRQKTETFTPDQMIALLRSLKVIAMS